METEGFRSGSHASSSKLGVNNAATPKLSDTPATQPRSGPVRYELIDSTGFVRGPFKSAADAMSYATKRWPDQTQDPDRTGRGWDVQVVGAK
jgi:hypothetical protein